MTEKFSRRIVFVLGGALALTFWAAIFGAASGVAVYGAICYFSPGYHNTFAAIVSIAAETMASIALPLTLFALLIAGFVVTQPGKRLRKILEICWIRSLMGAFLMTFIGSAIAATPYFANSPSNQSSLPAYFYGTLAGWFGGFFLGIVLGVVEAVVRIKKPPRPPLPPRDVPPLAAP